MRRYDGMDDLLQGVRDRIEASRAQAQSRPADALFRVELPVSVETYETAIGNLGVLLREAEQLRDTIATTATSSLTDEQVDHMLRLMGQLLEELWTCEAALQGVR